METNTKNGKAATPPGRKRKLILLLLVIVFVSGMVVGAASMPLLVLTFGPHIFPTSDEIPDLALKQIDEAIDLDDAQEKEVRRILKNHVGDMGAYRNSVKMEIDLKLDKLRKDMLEQLSDEQAEVWTELFDRHRERMFEFGPPFLWMQSGSRVSDEDTSD
jgi:hypothetical protein